MVRWNRLCVLTDGCESVLYEFMTDIRMISDKKVDIVSPSYMDLVVDRIGDKRNWPSKSEPYVKSNEDLNSPDMPKFILM